ncbi:MAG TPA: hypothetical protein ENN66_11270 [Proteobacteria bacterium]|nr:hypothetical protein [Pseudomonadota bacterium]
MKIGVQPTGFGINRVPGIRTPKTGARSAGLAELQPSDFKSPDPLDPTVVAGGINPKTIAHLPPAFRRIAVLQNSLFAIEPVIMIGVDGKPVVKISLDSDFRAPGHVQQQTKNQQRKPEFVSH